MSLQKRGDFIPMSRDDWYAMEVEEALDTLDTKKQGLDKEEVQIRLNKYGLNQLLEEKRITPLTIFLNQLKSTLVIILIISAILSGLLLREIVDTILIIIIVVLNAILSHHGAAEPISPVAIIVQAANEMSSSRPGARREVIENYVNRMRTMEEIAEAFEGVKTAYAIQAGKEVRIIIDHDKIDDVKSFQLASDISRKIQTDIDYPGQIKIVVIREFRAVDYA